MIEKETNLHWYFITQKKTKQTPVSLLVHVNYDKTTTQTKYDNQDDQGIQIHCQYFTHHTQYWTLCT